MNPVAWQDLKLFARAYCPYSDLLFTQVFFLYNATYWINGSSIICSVMSDTSLVMFSHFLIVSNSNNWLILLTCCFKLWCFSSPQLTSLYIHVIMFCLASSIKTCVRHRDCFVLMLTSGLAYKNTSALHLSMEAANYCIIYSSASSQARVESHVQFCLMTGHNSRVQDRTQVISTVSLPHYPPVCSVLPL